MLASWLADKETFCVAPGPTFHYVSAFGKTWDCKISTPDARPAVKLNTGKGVLLLEYEVRRSMLMVVMKYRNNELVTYGWWICLLKIKEKSQVFCGSKAKCCVLAKILSPRIFFFLFVFCSDAVKLRSYSATKTDSDSSLKPLRLVVVKAPMRLSH